jgi:multidrug efflux system membrane fusion protein
MKILRTVCVLVMAAAIVLLGGCKKATVVRPPIPVISTKVITADVPLYVESIGHCAAIESVTVVSQVSGQITAINFAQGQEVRSGDVLYAIDSRTYEANLKKAEAQLAGAEAKRRVNLAQLERYKSLVKQNYVSQQQYESYESQVEQDEAAVKSAEAQILQAKIDLDHCQIRAPICGIAGAYLVDAGNVVGAMAANRPVVTIENIITLYVEFNMSENDFPSLQRCFADGGKSLKVEIAAISDDSVSGEALITFLDNAINSKNGTIKLRAPMDNSDHKFWPGQSVRTKVLLMTLKDAVLVPVEAVKLGQQGRYSFAIRDDKSVELRPVETGQIHGDMLVVKSGLSGNETIVKRGQLMLAPGMRVVEMADDSQGMFEKSLEKNKKIAEENPTTR